MASTTSRRGWASGRPPAAGVLVDLLVWLPKSLPGALFAAQTARHPAVTATVQPSAKAAQPTGSETGTQRRAGRSHCGSAPEGTGDQQPAAVAQRRPGCRRHGDRRPPAPRPPAAVSVVVPCPPVSELWGGTDGVRAAGRGRAGARP